MPGSAPGTSAVGPKDSGVLVATTDGCGGIQEAENSRVFGAVRGHGHPAATTRALARDRPRRRRLTHHADCWSATWCGLVTGRPAGRGARMRKLAGRCRDGPESRDHRLMLVGWQRAEQRGQFLSAPPGHIASRSPPGARIRPVSDHVAVGTAQPDLQPARRAAGRGVRPGLVPAGLTSHLPRVWPDALRLLRLRVRTFPASRWPAPKPNVRARLSSSACEQAECGWALRGHR